MLVLSHTKSTPRRGHNRLSSAYIGTKYYACSLFGCGSAEINLWLSFFHSIWLVKGFIWCCQPMGLLAVEEKRKRESMKVRTPLRAVSLTAWPYADLTETNTDEERQYWRCETNQKNLGRRRLTDVPDVPDGRSSARSVYIVIDKWMWPCKIDMSASGWWRCPLKDD